MKTPSVPYVNLPCHDALCQWARTYSARHTDTGLEDLTLLVQRLIEREREKQPINTHTRLFDLVRYMRAELHEENLLTSEEYAWLSGGAGLAQDPKGGSPSPRRLEDYDDLRRQHTALRIAVEDVMTTAHCIAKAGPLNTPDLTEAWNKFMGISAACAKALKPDGS